MHTGRHRYRTHAGIPQGSTLNLGNQLAICYLWKEGYATEIVTITKEDTSTEGIECLTTWGDSGPNGNNATQTGDENEPRVAADGGIGFYNHGDDDSYADHMVCDTKFNVATDTPFLSFIVCNLDDASTSCYLSDSGTEVLQYTSGNQHQLKTGTTSLMNHSSVATVSTGSKHLFIVHRTGTETIKLYINGLEYDGSISNNGDFDIENIGVKNAASPSNWFDGTMYDLGLIDGNTATDANRILITNYLLAKHGIERLGLS